MIKLDSGEPEAIVGGDRQFIAHVLYHWYVGLPHLHPVHSLGGNVAGEDPIFSGEPQPVGRLDTFYLSILLSGVSIGNSTLQVSPMIWRNQHKSIWGISNI